MSTQTLPPAPGSVERLRNRHGVFDKNWTLSLFHFLSFGPGAPLFFASVPIFRIWKFSIWCSMQSYTQYHCKSFHDHLVGTKCQHFGYLVHHHSPYTSRDFYVSPFISSLGTLSNLHNYEQSRGVLFIIYALCIRKSTVTWKESVATSSGQKKIPLTLVSWRRWTSSTASSILFEVTDTPFIQLVFTTKLHWWKC